VKRGVYLHRVAQGRGQGRSVHKVKRLLSGTSTIWALMTAIGTVFAIVTIMRDTGTLRPSNWADVSTQKKSEAVSFNPKKCKIKSWEK